MTEIDLFDLMEHPEKITEESFRNCTCDDQFMLLEFRPDFLNFFRELHGPFSREDEVRLIVAGVLAFEDASHKDEFTADDIRDIIVEQRLSVEDFVKMNYAARLDARAWCSILCDTDPEDVWKDYCDFSSFSSEDWTYLLSSRPEFADRCPFEKLEQEHVETLLRDWPEWAARCGIKNPAGTYLLNDAPYTFDREEHPFFLPEPPADAPSGELSAWLKASFPGMSNGEASFRTAQICYSGRTLLGVFSRAAAEKKAAHLAAGLEKLELFRLQTAETAASETI